MKVRPEQLEAALAKGLRPVYLISGDEALLVNEVIDEIRVAARRDGFTERSVHVVDRSFNFADLHNDGASMSLFGDKKLIELRLASARPGAKAAAVLLDYAADPPPDAVLIVQAPKMDKSAASTKWVKALESIGALIQVWPVAESEFPSWLAFRMRRLGLQPERDAVLALAARVEGNLLAAQQEIDKLWTLKGEGSVTIDDIESMVTDSARFNVFKLVDTALAGDSAKCLRVLRGLREEGVEPVIIAWALAREIRSLFSMAVAQADRTPMQTVLANARVWGSRQGIVRAALSRHDRRSLATLLQASEFADRAVKGRAGTPAWDVLLGLCTGLALSKNELLASKIA